MNVDVNSRLVRFFQNRVQHYNHEKYWKMRGEVVNPHSRKSRFVRWIYLYRIKRMDAYANASFGTDMGAGARFASPPILPHHLNGIIISHHACFGERCIIFHQVTVANGEDGRSATIGNNCMLGAGSKILGHVTIGNNVRVGANAVVVHDVPDNCTVAGVPAKIVSRRNDAVSSDAI